MLEILLSGCNGHMGRVVADLAAKRTDLRIAAGVDPNAGAGFDFPVFCAPKDAPNLGAIIDFSHPSALAPLLEYAVAGSVPAVICTTGLSDRHIKLLERAAEKIPVFFSANMSLGVNLLRALAQKAAQILGGAFDVEIVEAHHNQKLDAPSGTALMLADAIHRVLPNTHYVYDRSKQRQKRDKREIGISAIRGGTIVGEHEILFAGQGEVLKLSHSAQSKELFAAGALNAAVFIADKPAGLYDMSRMIKI
ncbi:MAG: 4-hydroxy-tetrahydrodipicolinate reductase [Clostridium sp.]|jgi:4-hydroxy-tetrahydrodipicolinate reductase|nr:4-hydroxy-tetrahydrodipicolinate reductase [Clostridium sp.]